MAAFRGRGKQKTDANSPAYFTQKDGQRVANAVHAYETGRRGRNPSKLPRAPGGGGSSVDEATFTGAWTKGAKKSITFAADTARTALAVNLFRSIPIASDFGTRMCLVSPRSTTDANGEYVLVNAEC